MAGGPSDTHRKGFEADLPPYAERLIFLLGFIELYRHESGHARLLRNQGLHNPTQSQKRPPRARAARHWRRLLHGETPLQPPTSLWTSQFCRFFFMPHLLNPKTLKPPSSTISGDQSSRHDPPIHQLSRVGRSGSEAVRQAEDMVVAMETELQATWHGERWTGWIEIAHSPSSVLADADVLDLFLVLVASFSHGSFIKLWADMLGALVTSWGNTLWGILQILWTGVPPPLRSLDVDETTRRRPCTRRCWISTCRRRRRRGGTTGVGTRRVTRGRPLGSGGLACERPEKRHEVCEMRFSE